MPRPQANETCIRDALAQTHGHIGLAAKLLGLCRRTVEIKISRFGIDKAAYKIKPDYRARDQAKYQRHKERIKAQALAYYRANREAINARRSGVNRSAKLKARIRAWQQRNAASIRERMREWRRQNPQKTKEHLCRRQRKQMELQFSLLLLLAATSKHSRPSPRP